MSELNKILEALPKDFLIGLLGLLLGLFFWMLKKKIAHMTNSIELLENYNESILWALLKNFGEEIIKDIEDKKNEILENRRSKKGI